MRRLFGLLVVLGIGGCITPSIPIPPPSAELMTFTVTGDVGNTFATFAYPPHATLIDSDALVFVYNRDKGKGIIEVANADGSVGPTEPVRADLGDQIVVSFQRDDQTASTCIRLRDGAQDPTSYCDP